MAFSGVDRSTVTVFDASYEVMTKQMKKPTARPMQNMKPVCGRPNDDVTPCKQNYGTHIRCSVLAKCKYGNSVFKQQVGKVSGTVRN